MKVRDPRALWAQADSEHPGNDAARIARYRELMIEAGHLIPGEPRNLPCGWPHQDEADA